MPLQVVQAKATMPKPSFSSSPSRPASSRYSCTVFEPGASEDFTQGLRVRPRALALRASRPAAITLRGLEVLVQLVMAAMITAPSGISPCASCLRAASRLPAMPLAARSLVAHAHAGWTGRPCCAPRDRSKLSVRSYCALFSASAHRPASSRRSRPAHLRVAAAGQAQVVERLLVDEEHRRGGAVFGRHVGDGRAVAERQRRRAFAAELQIGADHFLIAQELGQCQHDVGGGDARLAACR
jgi:hypothetical protein